MRTNVVLAWGLLCFVGLACSDEVGLGGENDGEAGFGGESGGGNGVTGGTAGSGSGGTGGTIPNTCPPSLLQTAAAPGLLCDSTGQTCADSETFCWCTDSTTFEGTPWACVPTEAACPPSQPNEDDTCLSDASDGCNYMGEDGRVECNCEAGVFVCEPSDCSVVMIENDSSCDTPGKECAYFRPQYPGGPENAGNVPCVCGDDGYWSCDDGCPKEFTGVGGECDPTRVSSCNFRTDDGRLSCGCGGETAQWNCVRAGD